MVINNKVNNQLGNVICNLYILVVSRISTTDSVPTDYHFIYIFLSLFILNKIPINYNGGRVVEMCVLIHEVPGWTPR